MAFRRGGFALTPPSMIVFVISLVLAVVALLIHYAGIKIPVVNARYAFDLLAVGYVVLAIGVILRGV